MTIRFNFRYLVFFASMLFIFSCKKDDHSAPAPPVAEPTLFEKVQGKWFAKIEPDGRTKSPAVSGKNQVMPFITSVEFASDSTYILVFNYSEARIGKFSSSESSAFEFAGFGKIENIKVSDDSISFTSSYDDVPLTLSAVRAEKVSIADDKKALLKNWVLTEEEDGAAQYAGMQLEPGSLKMQFTKNGTWLTRVNDNYSSAQNWAWHPTVDGALVFHNGYQGQVNTNNYVKILELSSTRLKVQSIELQPVFDDNDEIKEYKEKIRQTLVLSAQ